MQETIVFPFLLAYVIITTSFILNIIIVNMQCMISMYEEELANRNVAIYIIIIIVVCVLEVLLLTLMPCSIPTYYIFMNQSFFLHIVCKENFII